MTAVAPFEPGAAEEWDELVGRAPMGTFLHTRRYLSHQGDRFRDASLLLRDDRDRLRGVLPAALDPADERTVVSHPGLTYGGVVHDGGLHGERMLDALAAVRAHYAETGVERLRYKAVPRIYHRRPSDDDLYALVRAGAVRVRADLSAAVDLGERAASSSRRTRSLKKARKEGVEIRTGAGLAPQLWPVLEDNLARRHGASPVHDVSEIEQLESLFPSEIRLVAGAIDGQVEGGTVLFVTDRVAHAQYIASSERGMAAGVLDAVFEHCIEEAGAEGRRYFDFGISTVDEGRTLNAGLHTFKAEFGGGGVLYEHYELAVEQPS